MKKAPVIAIGLDAGDPVLLEKWMAQGHLKNFSTIRQQGAYGRLSNTVNYCGIAEEMTATEALWPAFTSGCRADKTGYWDIIKYHPETYNLTCDLHDSGYSYSDCHPFYALGDQYQVAVFDLPYTVLSDQVNGIQLLGWGGTFPYAPSASQPETLFSEIRDRYGENPVLFNDIGIWWNKSYLQWENQALKQSINTRSAICQNLLERQPWDLFLTVFNETHTVGHDQYHLSDPEHVLYSYIAKNNSGPDPVLETYKDIDRAIGEILTKAPDDAYVLCFSIHGMGLNYSDLLSQTFLPEVLYRFNFPGNVAIAPNIADVEPPPIVTKPIRRSWTGEVWGNLYEPNPIKKFFRTWTHKSFLRSNHLGLQSPYSVAAEQTPMGWMPVMWFRPFWPQMKAFALPGFADGHIRINLQGREKDGIVAESEYETVYHELSQVLYRLKHGRTGQPIVKKVIRTRRFATDNDPRLPAPDLVVQWHEHTTDVVDSPDFGRIGPLTYFRAGSHWNRGFVIARGPGITPGSNLPHSEAVDLPPTILDLMGASIPAHFDGKPLLTGLTANLPV